MVGAAVVVEAPAPEAPEASAERGAAAAKRIRSRLALLARPFGMASHADEAEERSSSSAAAAAEDAAAEDAAVAAAEEAAWKDKETNYQGQILALEEEQATLRDAWSDIVRTNLAAADELRTQLKTQTVLRDEAQAQADAVLGELESQRNHLVCELANAKLRVAELSDKRDRAHHSLAELARGGRM